MAPLQRPKTQGSCNRFWQIHGSLLIISGWKEKLRFGGQGDREKISNIKFTILTFFFFLLFRATPVAYVEVPTLGV